MPRGRTPEPLPDTAQEFGIQAYVNLQEELKREESILRDNDLPFQLDLPLDLFKENHERTATTTV